MDRLSWAATPPFLKRFWHAMVKFGSPRLTDAAIRFDMLHEPCFENELKSEDPMCQLEQLD